MKAIELLKEALINIINNIDAGNSDFTDEQCLEYVDIINRATNTRNKMSKYQACKYLGVSRATFDNWVREGKIPKGQKQQGFKELFWELKDLKEVKDELNK